MFDKTLNAEKLTHESQLPQTDPSKTHMVKLRKCCKGNNNNPIWKMKKQLRWKFAIDISITDESQHKLKFRFVHGKESKSKLTRNKFQTFFSQSSLKLFSKLKRTFRACVSQNVDEHLGPEKYFSSRFSGKRDSRFSCWDWDWILRLTSVMCGARKRLTLHAFLLQYLNDKFSLTSNVRRAMS